MPSFRLLLVTAMLARTGSVALAWRADFDGPGNDSVEAVAFDGAGDVLAAGVADEDSLGCSSALRVLKLGGTDGHVVWEATRASGALDLATHVAVDARGDVVVGGLTGECVGSHPGSLIVLKLDGTTGGVLWTSVGAVAVTPCSLAVDRAGDVLVGGVAAVKLAGADGRELWRRDDLAAGALALDRRGDVLVAGATPPALTKLSASDGATMWQRPLPGAREATVAVDPSGNALAGWVTDVGIGVVELNGRTGAETWRRELTVPVVPSWPVTVVADRTGRVTAWTRVAGPTGGMPLVLSLARRDGRERWRAGSALVEAGLDGIQALTLERNGSVLVAGFRLAGDVTYFRVARLARRDGGVQWTYEPPDPATGASVAVAAGRRGAIAAAGATVRAGRLDQGATVLTLGRDESEAP